MKRSLCCDEWWHRSIVFYFFTFFYPVLLDMSECTDSQIYLSVLGLREKKRCRYSQDLLFFQEPIIHDRNKHQIHSVFPPVGKHSPKTLVECSRTLILGSQNSGDLSTIVYIIIIIYHVCDIIVGQGLPDYLTSRDLERYWEMVCHFAECQDVDDFGWGTYWNHSNLYVWCHHSNPIGTTTAAQHIWLWLTT